MELNKLHHILDKFQIKGSVVSIEPLTSGHINATYKVITDQECYVVQQINQKIFKEVAGLMDNLVRVTSHLKKKGETTLELVLTKESSTFLELSSTHWRMFHFILDSKTIFVLENEDQALKMGEAFGVFHQQLSDLPVPPLVEVLPDFHNTAKRIDDFKIAIMANASDRLQYVKDEVNFLLNLESEIRNDAKLENVPLRVVHQDPKLSNILFNQQDEIIAVIDLDTVMPGYLCYDFGDTIRAGLNTAEEDEKDLSKVGIQLDYFKAFARGYLDVVKTFITKEEVSSLVLGGKLIIYEQALRFLGDYINGDTYYSTHYPEHNLVRTRVQIALLKELMHYFETMHQFVLDEYNRL